ncbi:MAG TPA: hypothetical protein VGT24_09440 [Candidatus Acidoferrales bacterium]|nr:hypothetical protein [Candidatus Acidoferrales bacterium]
MTNEPESEEEALRLEASRQRLIYERNDLLTAVREKILREVKTKKERQHSGK